MFVLDQQTLYVVTLATAMLIPPLLIAAIATTERTPGTDDWIRGAACLAIGILGLMTRGWLPDLVSITLANMLIVQGYAFVAFGARRFFGLVPLSHWDYALTALIGAAMWYFSTVSPNQAARIVAVCLAIALWTGVATGAILVESNRTTPRQRKVLRLIGIMMAVTGLAMLVRAALHVDKLLGIAREADQMVESIYLFIAVVGNIGFACALPLMISLRVHRQLEDSQRRLARVHAVGRIGFVEYDIASNTVSTNSVYEHIFGVVPGTQRTAQQWIEAMHPDDRALGEARLRAYTDQSASLMPFEYRIIRPLDGEVRWILSLSERHLDSAGRVTHISTIATDITERKQAEEAILQAKVASESASRAKSEFLTNMSHEFRTPLHGVLGNAHLLSTSALDDEQRLCVQGVTDSARGLLGLVNDVLDHSSLDTDRLRFDQSPIDLPTMLHKLRREYAPQADAKGLALAIDEPPALPAPFVADAERVWQVLANLVSNAIKFTPGGTVHVLASILPAGAPFASAGIRFEIADTGVGISDDQLERLFTPFFQAESTLTRQHGGTGLGLSLAKRLVERMGGKISVHSRLGKGTTFQIDYPLGSGGEQGDATAPAHRLDPALLLSRSMNDTELASTLAAAAADDLRSLSVQAQAARAAANWPAAIKCTHDLRLLAGQLGDAALAARLKALEADFTRLAADSELAADDQTLDFPAEAINELAMSAQHWADSHEAPVA